MGASPMRVVLGAFGLGVASAYPSYVSCSSDIVTGRIMMNAESVASGLSMLLTDVLED